MDCSVGCSEIPKKDTSKTAPLDVKKVWSDEEAYFLWTVSYLFNSLQLIPYRDTNISVNPQLHITKDKSHYK